MSRIHYVGIRELKSRASQVVRTVCDEQTEYVVTHRGRPVARIVPFESSADVEPQALTQLFVDIDELAQMIALHWPIGVTAVDAVREVRRDL